MIQALRFLEPLPLFPSHGLFVDMPLPLPLPSGDFDDPLPAFGAFEDFFPFPPLPGAFEDLAALGALVDLAALGPFVFFPFPLGSFDDVPFPPLPLPVGVSTR